MRTKARTSILVTLTVIGLSLLGTPPAMADDPNLLPYPFDVPDLNTCPPLIPQVFRYSNDVLAPQGCVAALQQSLQAVGFMVAVTGDYEAETYGAIWNFQLARSADGLSATGTADSETLAVLDRIANSPAALSTDNGVDRDGNWRVQPPLPAPITTVRILENTQPTVEELPDDCATTCDDVE
jgi:peptidoglycan hydrolase-like protein with peptidoglycan-binding domain